ncbi:hypothetical protein IIC38_08035 [candidate division KSB1 bacterium]|nr:hypothetical protein [candidate division KSB1 bacterium]
MLKNITLSAEEILIHKARERAYRERSTLNAEFRKWLQKYVRNNLKISNYDTFMESLKYVHPGKTFSRDEMND